MIRKILVYNHGHHKKTVYMSGGQPFSPAGWMGCAWSIYRLGPATDPNSESKLGTVDTIQPCGEGQGTRRLAPAWAHKKRHLTWAQNWKEPSESLNLIPYYFI